MNSKPHGHVWVLLKITLQMLHVLSIRSHSSFSKLVSSGFVVTVYLWDDIHLGLHCYVTLFITHRVLKVWDYVKVPPR